jgi:AraC-like DNA-binding protein
MKFQAYIPCAQLRPYVDSLIVQETAGEQTYKVLPGTGLVIGFQYQGRLSFIENGQETSLSTAGISGLNDRYRMFTNSANTGTVLVVFKEAGAMHFFREPLHELFRESISLDHFMLRSELLLLEEQLKEAATDRGRIGIVEKFLCARLRAVQPDQLVLSALSLIHKSKGTIRIKDLAQQLFTSQSPLEKRFRHAVGTSPKKFASIIRLKHAIQHFADNHSLTALGYEAGFYDQAHFIKEFRSFTGETPAAFYRDK